MTGNLECNFYKCRVYFSKVEGATELDWDEVVEVVHTGSVLPLTQLILSGTLGDIEVSFFPRLLAE